MFFGGWSFDYKPFEYLDCENNDIVMIYDYSNLDFTLDFSGYKNYTLITWSMGVFIAYYLRDKLPNFNKKIAINGTPYPIDNDYGIPERTFALTLKYVDTGLQGKFYQNLFYTPDEYEQYTKTPVERTIENRAEELRALNDFIKLANISYDKFYDTAIISDFDKIIPTKNQHNFWEGKAHIKTLVSGHFPFYNFKSWTEL